MTSATRRQLADAASAPDRQRLIRAWVSSFDAGLTRIGAMPFVIVCMHLGPSVAVSCMRGGVLRAGRETAGDLEIVPARTPAAWRTDQGGTTLLICVPDVLLRIVATQLGRDPACIHIADRFRMRDPIIEHIAWALKADIDAGRVGGRPLRDSLGAALAVQLLQRHFRGSLPMRTTLGGLRQEVLERVISHIEDNLGGKLSLAEIAAVAGMSVSHLKALFRNATGLPVYKYVLRRRVERAQLLLRDRNLPLAQVALATGFSHQSHLARHMQRVLGSTPATVRKNLLRQSAAAQVHPSNADAWAADASHLDAAGQTQLAETWL
jgi:AraC family transcriptional regulator